MAQKKQLEEALKTAKRNNKTSEKTQEAKDFIRAKAKVASKENTLRKSKRRTKLLGDESKVATTIEYGHMYFYNYDPKYKDILPYYDKYPLVIPFDTYKGNIVGLNLHYLPPKLRAILLDAILDLTDGKSKKQQTKLTYDIVKSFSASSLAIPCIKQYIPSHITSNIIEIAKDEWNTVVFLPLANWDSKTGSANAGRVYTDSKNKI